MTSCFPDDKRIKRSSIEKLYFNRFGFRVHTKYSTGPIFKEHLTLAMQCKGDWDYRMQWSTTSFYFSERDDAVTFSHAVAPHVEEINEPSECFPHEILRADPNIHYRRDLWFRKFRYKVNFKGRSQQLLDDLEEFLSDHFSISLEDTVPSSDRAHASVGSHCVVYVGDAEDLLLFRLRYDKEIQSVNTALLHHEFDCQAST